MNPLRRVLARRRLAASLTLQHDLAAHRLAHMSPARAERYRRNRDAIRTELGL